MSEPRYCKECKQNTLHDTKNSHKEDYGGAGRIFLGVCTFGFSEGMNKDYYVCQVCGKETDK